MTTISATTIKAAIDRLDDAVARRPGFGVGTNRSVTTLAEGMRCVSAEADWHMTTDLPAALGGAASAPTPGALVRAAFGSCMAMSYRLRAAKHGVELDSVTVTVEADSEIAGMLSCSTVAPPGFTSVRYHVEIESSADDDEIERIVDEADRLSPILDVFTRRNHVERTVSIRRPGG